MEPPEAETAGVFADLFNFSDDLFLETPRLSDDQHQQQLSIPHPPPPIMATKTEGGEEERPTRHEEEYDDDDEDFLGSFPEVTVDELRWVLNREGESALDNFDVLLSTLPEPKRPSPVSVLESAPRWWPAPQKKRTKGRQKKMAAFPVFKVPTKERRDVHVPLPGAERRRCWHCAAEETPQWRAGPEGPKTLCNACGVRFKSGRLLPEYRPASSPTFSSELHSNSHRKVIEMRRWKEKETGSGFLPPAATAAGTLRRRKKKKEKGGVVGGNPRIGTGVPVRNFY